MEALSPSCTVRRRCVLVVPRSSYSKADALIPYLLKHGNRFPLIFQDGDESIATEFDDDRRYAARTEINVLDGSSVIATRRCLVDGERPENDIELFDEVVVDRKARKLGLVRDIEGWEPWQALRHAITAAAGAGAEMKNIAISGTTITVPIDFFQHLQFTYPLPSRANIRKVLDLRWTAWVEGRPLSRRIASIAAAFRRANPSGSRMPGGGLLAAPSAASSGSSAV
jgi:hypothetical protein